MNNVKGKEESVKRKTGGRGRGGGGNLHSHTEDERGFVGTGEGGKQSWTGKEHFEKTKEWNPRILTVSPDS